MSAENTPRNAKNVTGLGVVFAPGRGRFLFSLYVNYVMGAYYAGRPFVVGPVPMRAGAQNLRGIEGAHIMRGVGAYYAGRRGCILCGAYGKKKKKWYTKKASWIRRSTRRK